MNVKLLKLRLIKIWASFKRKPFSKLEAVSRRGIKQEKCIIKISSISKGPNSLLIKFEKQKYKALLDSGAEVSLISRRVYDSFKIKPKLFKHSLNLSTAANTPMHVDGFSELTFTLGGLKMSHKFYVVQNLNRNVIIGLDWLKSRGVRVYHDLSCIRVHETYIPLIDDMHVASIANNFSIAYLDDILIYSEIYPNIWSIYNRCLTASDIMIYE